MLTGLLAPGSGKHAVARPDDSASLRVGPWSCEGGGGRELRFELLDADAEPVVPAGMGPPVCLADYRLPDGSLPQAEIENGVR